MTVQDNHSSISSIKNYLLVSLVVLLGLTDVCISYAQTHYTAMLRPRRVYNQLHVEIWLKATSSSAPRFGYASFAVKYDPTNLTPVIPSPNPGNQVNNAFVRYLTTDSIDVGIVDATTPATAPVRYIPSAGTGTQQIANVTFPGAGGGGINGYLDPQVQIYGLPSDGVFSFEVRRAAINTNGAFVPDTVGRGTFVGKLIFSISGSAISDTALARFQWNNNGVVGPVKVFAFDSTDITNNIQYETIAPFPILGTTVLYPNGPANTTVDRDRGLTNPVNPLQAPTISAIADGWPIYFERSIDPSSATYYTAGGAIDNDNAYLFEYSLNSGSSWTELGRIEENAAPVGGTDQSGEVEIVTATSLRNLSGVALVADTTWTGPQASHLGSPLLAFWTQNRDFQQRSENARIRVTPLDGVAATNITARTTFANRMDMSDNDFVLGRLFFVQLNGTSNFLRSRNVYVNSTQVTVEAWVNLNEYKAQGSETGIVAFSGGPNSTTEGTWMLYLKDGRYPAFRAREIEGRGPNGYIADVWSKEPLPMVSSATLSPAHLDNWHHIAATVNNNVVTLYLNGEIIDRVTNTNHPTNIRMGIDGNPGSGRYYVGINPNPVITAGDYLNAGIKGARVWRTALHQDSIRQRVSGLAVPSSVDPTIENLLTLGLDVSYTLEGSLLDQAINPIYQFGIDNVNLYTSVNGPANDGSIRYRPDLPHIRLTSPTGGEGISNNATADFEVRWVGYGLGITDVLDNSTTLNPANGSGAASEIMIEYSIDNGASWSIARNTLGATQANKLGGDRAVANNIPLELGKILWRPFNSNGLLPDAVYGADANADLTTATYSNPILVRIRGNVFRVPLNTANPDSIYGFTSNLATLAPYSAISGLSTTPLVVPSGTDLNFSGQTAFFEAWIRPYQFPTGANKLPILVKKDSTTGQLHYALRLLSSGQLEFSVRDTSGAIRVAVSDSAIGKRVLPPNFSTTDSTWTHVGAFVSLGNGGQSQVVFYIDGVPQTDTVITNRLGSNVRLNTTNTFPTYIGFEPGNAVGFVGQLREVRMWNGTPGSSVVPAQVANRDLFVQGALTAKGFELATAPNNYTTNLAASFNLETGGFVNGPSNSTERYWKSISSSNPNVRARFIGNPPTYTAQIPFIKLVEPTYKQLVRASATNVKVRWVGFNYSNAAAGGATNGFYEGGNVSTAAGITAAGIPVEYSLLGGGGNLVQPYQPVSTTDAAWGGAASNAFGLAGPFATTQYVFAGSTGQNLRFAGNLNASIADPDFNNDGTTTDAGRLSGAPANGRLRLRGVYGLPNSPAVTVFDTAFTQGPLFDVAPSSNFSVRVALEGRHNNLTANAVNLPSTYNMGGTKIYLYADNGGIPGALVDSSESTFGYGSLVPNAAPLAFSQLVSPPPAAASEYVTIPHVFSTLTGGNYWVVVQHLNHLPIMSRFPAKFDPVGDNYISYLIESGWDFLSWNGADNTVMTAAQFGPIFGNYNGYGAGGDGAVIAAGTAGTYARGVLGYSAYGQAISTLNNQNYSATGLIFNDGISGVIGVNSVAAMVGGNVVKDNQINAADVVRVQARSGSADVESDVTGDGTVNASDRNIVQRNFGKSNSIQPVFPLMFASNTKDVVGDENAEAIMVASENPELYNRVNAIAAEYINNGRKAAQIPYKQSDNILSTHNFVVSATPVRLGNFVEVPVYVRNVGQPWAMANATFALGFNSSVLEYVGYSGADQVLFSNKPDKGYVDVVKSAPDANTPNPLPNVRTIEVNYDAFSKRAGEVVPNTNSYLGTLRFEIKDTERPISFKWEEWASAIYETQGNNITSNAEFKPIPALLSYTANIMIPDGGESWRANRQYIIEWSGTSSATVRIEYSLDGGQTWSVVGEAAAQDRQYSWTTPTVTTTAALVRVVDKETGYEVDRSASTFRIQNIMANISKPSQMDPIYRSGTSDLIRWSQVGLDNVRFEFSSNDGGSWISVSSTVDATTGQVSWVVPAGVTTKTALVRMLDIQSGDEMARSGSFKVLSGNVDILDPTSKFMPGNIERVRWTTDITNFDLQYSLNGGISWVDAAKGVQAAKGWFDWTVPMANTFEAKLRAILLNDPEMEYDRTINFTIGNPTSVGETKSEAFSIVGVTPNPMMKNGIVKVMNTVPQAVTVSLMNSIGQTVEIFHNELMLGIGEHSIPFDVRLLPNGTYYVRIATGDVSKTQTIVIQR